MLASLLSAALSTINYSSEFLSWKLEHAKTYASGAAEVQAFTNFVANLEDINAHNAQPGRSWTKGLNQFSDLSLEQFRDEIECMDMEDGSGAGLSRHSRPAGEILPREVDWS